MLRDEAYPSKYLKAADILGKQVKFVIMHAHKEMIQNEEKLVCYFSKCSIPELTNKVLVVNATNWDAIEASTGEPDSDNWPGKVIMLITENARNPQTGKMAPAVRVSHAPQVQLVKKVPPQAVPLPPADEDFDADMDDQIPF